MTTRDSAPQRPSSGEALSPVWSGSLLEASCPGCGVAEGDARIRRNERAVGLEPTKRRHRTGRVSSLEVGLVAVSAQWSLVIAAAHSGQRRSAGSQEKSWPTPIIGATSKPHRDTAEPSATAW